MSKSVATQERQLPIRRVLLIGGLGGLAPTVASLLIADATTVANYIQNITQGAADYVYSVLGYGFRVTLLFAVGAFWAYLYRHDNDPKKLFQFGIMAPAMLTAMINATRITDNAAVDEPSPTAAFALVSPAYAQEQVTQPGSSPDKPSGGFIRGLLGRP